MKIDVEAARALLERVSKAVEPSRDLDAAIEVTFDLRPAWARDIAGKLFVTPPHNGAFGPFGHVRVGKNGPGWEVATYTSSLDAAIVLVGRVLPEAAWGVSVEPPVHGVKYHAFVGDHYPHFDAKPGRWWGEADYADGAALAFCAALLKAVIARAEAGDRT